MRWVFMSVLCPLARHLPFYVSSVPRLGQPIGESGVQKRKNSYLANSSFSRLARRLRQARPCSSVSSSATRQLQGKGPTLTQRDDYHFLTSLLPHRNGGPIEGPRARYSAHLFRSKIRHADAFFCCGVQMELLSSSHFQVLWAIV